MQIKKSPESTCPLQLLIKPAAEAAVKVTKKTGKNQLDIRTAILFNLQSPQTKSVFIKTAVNNNNTQDLTMKKHAPQPGKARFFSLKFLLIIAFLITPAASYAEQILPKITVYKSPTCGCCTKWVKHLEQNGFIVEAFNSRDMSAVKRQMGITRDIQSCHTGEIDGYFIEGHVPADDIKRLLKEKPEAAGLTVPGMPMGSPGMEGHRKDAYSVLLVSKDGKQEVFSKH